MPLPERFRSDSSGNRFRVSWAWRSPAAFMLLVFAVAWWAFLVNWYSLAMSSGDLFAIVFPIAHVAVGIGDRGEARVVSIDTRGGGVNGHPRVEFELDVTLAGKESYRTQISAIVSKLAIPRIQPGCEIEVRVDPAHRDSLVIDEALTPYRYE